MAVQPNIDPGPLFGPVPDNRWGDAALLALVLVGGIILAIAVILRMANLA